MTKPVSSRKLFRWLLKKFDSPFVFIKCWSTLPKWEKDNLMNVQPSKHLILINGYTYQGQWHERDSHLSLRDPYALAECWRNYFNNQIIDVIHNLWKDYHFIGITKRIFVSSPKPYATAISHIQFAKHSNPRSFIIPRRTLEYEPLLYCGFCKQYAIYHEHECNNDPLWDPYNGYPSNAPDTD